MPKTLKKLEAEARRMGKRGDDWQTVLDSMRDSITAMSRYNPAKRRRIESRLLGAVLRGNAERKGLQCWFADDEAPL